jgi:hypothetical protein
VVHYSDTAHPGAQVIQLPAAQTYHSPPTRPTDPVNSPAAGSCAIRDRAHARSPQPAAEASFFAPDSVAVSVSPALQPGDQLAVTLDGAPLGSGGGGQFQIQQPDRGAHTVSAMVRDAERQAGVPIHGHLLRTAALGAVSNLARARPLRRRGGIAEARGAP